MKNVLIHPDLTLADVTQDMKMLATHAPVCHLFFLCSRFDKENSSFQSRCD